MKLVFLSHDGNCNGGAQKCLVDLLRGLRLKYPDIKIYMIFPYDGELIAICSPYIDGYKVFSMQWWLMDINAPISIKKKLSFIFKAIKKALKISCYLWRIKPDYAITNTIVLPYLALACRFLLIKHIWFIHEIPATWSDRRFVFTINTVYKWVDWLSQKVLVPSNYAKNFYAQEISADKIGVVDQAVDIEPVLPSLREKHERYTILLVGAFDSNKGQLELLQAVNEIIASGKDVFCYLVGPDIGTMISCKEYVALHKLKHNVSIVSFVTDIWKYYALSDVLVVCSILETFGRVAVEAQKCGLPVILSNVGANPERVMDNVNGLLYQKGNLSDLVNKIETLRDDKTRKSFANNITLLNLKRYSPVEFASNFMKEL